jgi:peptidoglycan/LPS O-acetylase OafA/YrhL
LDFYISNNLNWSTFFANLANLQGILINLQGVIIKQFGSNGPLWSLAYEWWYYCLFALILELFRKKCTDFVFLVLVVIALCALMLSPVNLLLFMVVWGAGAWAAIIDSKHLNPPPYIGCGLFILLLIGSRVSHILLDGYIHDPIVSMVIRIVRDFSLAMGFSLLVISLRNMRYPVVRYLALHKLMADFSFTIYLLHVPLLVFITAILSSQFGMPFFVQPSPQVFLVTISILLIIYVVLFICSLVTEKYTPNVKRYLTKLIPLNRLESKARAF